VCRDKFILASWRKEHLWLTLTTQYNRRERLPSRFLEEIGYDNWGAMDASRLDIPGISCLHDEQIKSMENVWDSELEREKVRRKRLITEPLDSGSLEESPGNLLAYHASLFIIFRERRIVLRNHDCQNGSLPI
jgi:hypothetical protein